MNKIRDLRKKKGWTQEELGNRLGINKVTVSGYESEKRQPTPEMLSRIADLFDVSIDTVLGRDTEPQQPSFGRPIVPGDPALAPKALPAQPLPDPDRETALIPILGSVRAGYDNYAEENLEGYLPVDDRLKAVHPEVYVLNVKGDSMEPEIKHGDIVICAPDAEVRSGDVAIVCVNGDVGTVKRIRIDHDGLTLVPANPSYKKLHYSPEDVRSYPVSIQAKVIEVRHRYV